MPTAASESPEPRGSPAVPPPRGQPRTEWKLVMPPPQALAVFAEARRWMQPDPHALQATDACYEVESVYFDTSTLACFAQSGEAEFPKYRLRHYGSGCTLFLEEKLRRRDQVWKRRVPIAGGDADHLLNSATSQDPGVAWFQRRLRTLGLKAVLAVGYRRHALVGSSGERLTIDLDLHAAPPPDHFGVRTDDPGVTLTADAVLEIKFNGSPTSLVKGLHDLVGSTPVAFSKYRLAVRMLGLCSPATGVS